MFTGIVVRVISNAYGIEKLGFLDDLIPVLGTVGLILIVLEGALELEIKREKLFLILKGIPCRSCPFNTQYSCIAMGFLLMYFK